MGELEQELAQDVGRLAGRARDGAYEALWLTLAAVVIALSVVAGLFLPHHSEHQAGRAGRQSCAGSTFNTRSDL